MGRMKRVLGTVGVAAGAILLAGCGSQNAVIPATAPAAVVPQGPVKEFTMIAKQFVFEPSTITVNKGDTVKLTVTSTDVKHGISIPDFNVKADVDAGQSVTVTFVADKQGTFPFRCSVLCGDGHREMTGMVIVK